MRYSQRRTRNYIIMGLCMVLVVMTVSYAAFSQQLTINSSAGTTTKWCLGFDTTVTGNVSASAGLTGATAPTGTITYDGNTCDGNYNSGASLASTLHQPGDTVTYTLTIKNSSTIDAAINSITVNNQNTVSDKEVKIGNIVFVVGMPESTSLSAGSSTIMTVTAKFQDETDITGGYNGENASITVNVNATQDGGSGGFEKKFSGIIYRYGTEYWNNGMSLEASTIYSITADGEYGHGPAGDYDTLEACQDDMTNKYNLSSPYTCKLFEKAAKVEGTDYVKNASLLNKTYYLKYKVVDDVISESYTCFVMGTKEKCLKGADTSVYASNQAIIREYQAFYNLNESSSIPGCRFNSVDSICDGGGFDRVASGSAGDVGVYGLSSGLCGVSSDGNSYCTQ